MCKLFNTVPGIWQVLMHSWFCIFKSKDQLFCVVEGYKRIFLLAKALKIIMENQHPEERTDRQEGRETRSELIPK